MLRDARGRALTGLILIVVIVAMPEGILGQILKRFRATAPARAPVVRAEEVPRYRRRLPR